MTINYNKLNFIGAIIGLAVGVAALIGTPLIISGKIPQESILYIILGIMAFVILFLLGMMVLLLLSNNIMVKLIAPIFIPIIASIVYFGLITYQELGPQLADPAKLPYFDWVQKLDLMHSFGSVPYYATGIFFIFLLPFIIYMLKFQYQTAFTREDTFKNGIRAQAKIISILDYGMRVNNQPVFKISLEVHSPSQGTYQVTKDFFVPQMDLANMKVGDTVAIKIDPDNPKNVAFDTWTGNIPS